MNHKNSFLAKSILFFVIMFVFQGFLQVHADQTWTEQKIDPLGLGGRIVFDSNDIPHIMYIVSGSFTSGDINLNYVVWDGTNWTTQTLAPPENGGGHETGLWNGTNWALYSIDWDVLPYRHSVAALDSNNNLHTVFSYSTSDSHHEIRYAYWTGTNWTVQTADSSRNNLSFPSFVLDSHNYPHISYHDAIDNLVKYATWNPNMGWNVTAIDTANSAQSAIAIDSKGNPHVIYGVNRSLKYAHWNGETWNIQTVEQDRLQAGLGVCIVLDSKDNPHIGFSDSGSGFMYAKWTGANWKVEMVSSVGIVNSLALDSNDQPHLLSSRVSGTYHGLPRYAQLTYYTLPLPETQDFPLLWIAAITIIAIAGAILVYFKTTKRHQKTNNLKSRT